MEHALPQFIHFGREVCNDLEQAERREWWLANGLGGYASGTVANTLTRRYHGLLVAALQPPLGRTLLFAKADAALIAGANRHPLHSNRWAGGALEPRGHMHLESFRLDGAMPVWRYAVGDIRLEARIWMEHGANTTCLAWRLLSEHDESRRPRLAVRLLVNARDHHAQTPAGAFDPVIAHTENELRVNLPGSPALLFRSRCGRFTPDKTWIEHFDLPMERARGLPDQDNHLCVGEVELPLHHPGEWVGFVASLEDDPSPYLAESMRQYQHRSAGQLRQANVQNDCLANAPDWIDQLLLSAQHFIVDRAQPNASTAPSINTAQSIIAGYPWFGDWGRDTFIALPGLTLINHRHDDARRILEGWAEHIDAGLLPNRFPENGAPAEYNSADATLWYVEAWRAFIESSRDLAALARSFPTLARLLDDFASRASHGIALDPTDGLIRAGDADSQLTWMDARVNGRPVTPRAGKPVEINALWYNALMSLADFAVLLGENPEPFASLAEQAQSGFRRFVRADGSGLYDVLDGLDGDDASVRPNQILAVSLHHSPLGAADQTAVTRTVGERLATTYGLRTLDPDDPACQPRYEGDVPSRDGAYHQGAAWAWLLPHYALAVYRVSGDADCAQALLEPLRDHLADAGLGAVSELFDAEPPHTPRGAPAQAWSVACALQAWCRLEQARKHCHA